MEITISESLVCIARNSEKLNAKADTLTKQVTALSKHLQNLQVGLSCFYTKERYDSRTQTENSRYIPCSFYLGFGKDDNGNWGIVVLCKPLKPLKEGQVTIPNADETSDWQTLWVRAFDACPRDVRLALTGYIPQLLAGLATTVESVVSSVEVSLKDLEKTEQELSKALAGAAN